MNFINEINHEHLEESDEHRNQFSRIDLQIESSFPLPLTHSTESIQNNGIYLQFFFPFFYLNYAH